METGLDRSASSLSISDPAWMPELYARKRFLQARLNHSLLTHAPLIPETLMPEPK